MKRNYLLTTLWTLCLAIAFVSCNDSDDDSDEDKFIPVQDRPTKTIKASANGTGTVTWDKDTIYLLDGKVFVNSGQTLTIEAGTVIKGKSGAGESSSALIVAKGAKIMAEGTATAPIIFTGENDKVDGTTPKTTTGLWGGLIILGKAKINTDTPQKYIEGLDTNDDRSKYGGTDDSDNSGVIKYVSIRHGGSVLGADNEINGLTLGAVGSGTTIDYVEVYANKDDGIEFFGGTVKVNHAVVSYCQDDTFDYDQGYRGGGQFWCGIQAANAGDRLGEFDGADTPEDGTPFGIATIYNATFIGRGADAGKKCITYRANGGGYIYNSIFFNQAKGIDIEIKKTSADESSYKRLKAGQIEIENNIFFNVGDGTQAGVVKVSANKDKQGNQTITDAYKTEAETYFAGLLSSKFQFTFVDLGLKSDAQGLSVVPNSSAKDNKLSAYKSGFTQVDYKGAFEPGVANHWAKGWTKTFK